MTPAPNHIRILRARRHIGLTQQQLAERIGVQRSAVAQWERLHGTRPASARLVAVALVTGVNFDWLATGRGNMLVPVDSTFELSAEEVDLVRSLRRLSPPRQAAVVGLIGALND